jgi:hypothetical protein
MPDWDLLAQPEPDIEFDQRVSWYTRLMQDFRVFH